MAAEHSDVPDREERLGAILVACLEAIDRGQFPGREEWLARYPEFAAELSRFLDDQERVERCAAPLRAVAVAAAGGASVPQDCTSTVADANGSRPADPLRRLGDYELLEEIGRGGMATVYRARQRSLGRTVAVKVIRAADGAARRDAERFRREAELAAHLDHPHIVPVHEVGEQDGYVYFSMKLIEGGSLADRLDRFTADPRAAARLLALVARAVHHAHQRGVLHRDLKPANVLLDAEGQPHVTDFGLARRVEGDSSLTQSGALVGTPSYMAPEQTTRERAAVTTAADVYGLGAVLYALLTGRPPFRAETAVDTLLLVREREPEPLRRSNARVDRDLETVCLKCLQKEPARRYGSAEALAEDLERWLAGEPIQARRSSSWERLWKWVRRRPTLSALLAVLALSMVALVVGLLWHNERLRAEAEKTARERDVAREEQGWAAQAVDDMYTRVAEQWLGPRPRLQPLQREFLEKALEYYQYAAGRWADDPGLRRKVPPLYLKVATINAALGRHDRAEEALRKAITGFEELAAGSPTDPVVRNDLLRSTTSLGETLQATGRVPEAVEVYRRAIGLAVNLADDFPGRPDFRNRAPIARTSLAFVLAGAGHGEEAERLYREALAELDRLPPEVRDQPDVRFCLENTRNNLGNLYFIAGRFTDAEPLYRQAAAGLERLTKEFQANTDYRERWAFTLGNWGAALFELGRTADARPVFTQAESVMHRLAEDFPDLPDLPSELANIRSNLGMALRKLGELDEAEKSYRKAIGTLRALADRFPGVPEHCVRLGIAQYNLANLLQDTGRLPEAEGARREAVETRAKLAHEFAGVAIYRASLAEGLFGLGNTLTRVGKFTAADGAYTQALGLQEKLLAAEPGNPAYGAAVASTSNNLAFLLVWEQNPPYTEANRAVELAKRAVQLGPPGGSWWRVLGWAQIRAGHWREGLQAIERARGLNTRHGADYFFEAVARWHLGEKDTAREAYHAGIAWLERQQDPTKQALRLRDEAAAVLGITAGVKREQGSPGARPR